MSEGVNVNQTSGLTVRQHEREGNEVPIEFVVCEAHATQVRFSPSSGALTPHVIRGEAIDISSGGMGLRSRQFVPRMCEGTVRVFAVVPDSKNADGSPVLELMFEQMVKVRRVTLVGREPVYSLGVAFINHSEDLDRRITTLFDRIQDGGRRAMSAGVGGNRA